MDSDEEYVQELSDDEVDEQNGKQGSGYGTRSTRSKGRQAGQAGRTKERWEDIQRSWDLVTEGADGSLAGTVEGLLEAGKRKRLLKDTTPLQRGIIRHLVLVLDMSTAMTEKDMRPTRYLLTLRYAAEFVKEYFEQNPISQLGILGMREGLAVRISDMSGNPAEHITALQALRDQDPKGNPSLQNALEMARASLFHTPSHGTREVLIVFGALLTSDPGDIHATIRSLVTDKIRVSVIGLAARLAICTELCARTHGLSKDALSGSTTSSTASNIYGVAMHEQHFRDLLLAQITPPVIRASDRASAAPSLLMMGFPSRIEESTPTLCACHGTESSGGYLCSRCKAKVCTLPAQCPTCDLQLIQSTHLARSYHHLFPLRNYKEVSWERASAKGSVHCFACLTPFPPVLNDEELADKRRRETEARVARRSAVQKGASESSRYECSSCGEHFCIDCDVFAHEVTHNCAGCLSKPGEEMSAGEHGNDESNGYEVSSETGGDGMEIA